MAFLVLALCARGKPRRRTWLIRRSDLPRFVVAGITGYTCYQLGFVLGLDRTSAFSSALLIAMVPLFTMVWLTVMGEPTTARGWLGLGVSLAGVVIFLAEKWGEGGTLAGDALSLGAAISFSLYTVINRPLVREYPAETYSAYSVLAGTLPLLVIALPSAFDKSWGDVSARSWLAVAYMVVFPVYLAYMLWNWAIARRGAAAASSFGLLQPIIAGMLSAIVFAEGFGPAKLLGAALVLIGLITVRSKPRRNDAVTSSKGEQ
jgi:drug/metabolite transporter (DMT)-like permease